jgi:hypothetical protein
MTSMSQNSLGQARDKGGTDLAVESKKAVTSSDGPLLNKLVLKLNG